MGRVFKVADLRTNDPLMPKIHLRLNVNLLANPDGSQRSDLTVRPGKHIGPFFIEPSEHAGVAAPVGEAARGEFVITAEREALNITGVESDVAGITARLEPIEAGKRYRLIVETAAQASPGRITANLRLTTDSKSMPTLPLQFTLNVKKPLGPGK